MASLNILCSNPFNLKTKIRKIEHQKIFCGPSKILKNTSWPINIYLKYFITPTKTHKNWSAKNFVRKKFRFLLIISSLFADEDFTDELLKNI